MRNIIICACAAVAIALAVACGKPSANVNHDELVGRAVKTYYEYLLHGKYEAYVDGFYRPDSIPDSYREQLIVNAKMYMAQMKENHQGLQSVSIARAKADTAKHVGEAFLVLNFADNTREEIVVPVVLHNDNWMLR